MVTIRYAGDIALWDGKQWQSANESLAVVLNTAVDRARGYLPAAVNARAMCEATLPPGWEIVSADSEPHEPGAVY